MVSDNVEAMQNFEDRLKEAEADVEQLTEVESGDLSEKALEHLQLAADDRGCRGY